MTFFEVVWLRGVVAVERIDANVDEPWMVLALVLDAVRADIERNRLDAEEDRNRNDVRHNG
jgi:hypothetical protein